MANSNMIAEYIDHMGSDLSVVNSAKASFGKHETEFKPKEHTRLINYLATGLSQADREAMMKEIANLGSIYADTYDGKGYDDNAFDEMVKVVEQYRHTPTHFSPFCHATISIRLKAPIAIHAQFMKHTVGFSHNTVSRRYVSDTPEFFVPTFRHAPTGNIKQGSGGVITKVSAKGTKWATEYPPQDTVSQDDLQGGYQAYMRNCIEYYEDLIKLGVAPEQARFVLPQGVMTEWVTTGSLYAWARLYNLRADGHAQKEIQTLAHMIGLIIEPLFPVSWKALTR